VLNALLVDKLVDDRILLGHLLSKKGLGQLTVAGFQRWRWW
jgi:hypothetical protein